MSTDKQLMKVTIGLYIGAVVLLVLLVCALAELYARRPVSNCSEYSSRAEVMDAFTRGVPHLDADGDGIPCENIK